jgi:hypothetical protein
LSSDNDIMMRLTNNAMTIKLRSSCIQIYIL